MALSGFCICQVCHQQTNLEWRMISHRVCQHCKGFWFCPGGHDRGQFHGPIPLHMPRLQWTQWRSQQFQSKTEASRSHKAILWNLEVTTGSKLSRRKHTLVSESISEEDAVRGSFGEHLQDFLAQHTWGGHTDRQGFGEARVIFILHLQGGISHHQPNLPLLQKKQTV